MHSDSVSKLRQARLDRHLTITTVAMALHVSDTHLCVLETRGSTQRPSDAIRHKLCEIYGKTEAELDIEPFKNNMQAARKAKHMTPKMVSTVLGTHEATYTTYERGIQYPPNRHIYKMMKLFDVTDEELGYLIREEVPYQPTREVHGSIPVNRQPTKVTYEYMSERFLKIFDDIRNARSKVDIMTQYDLDSFTYRVCEKIVKGGLSLGTFGVAALYTQGARERRTQAAIDMYHAGLSIREIANNLHLSASTIREYLGDEYIGRNRSAGRDEDENQRPERVHGEYQETGDRRNAGRDRKPDAQVTNHDGCEIHADERSGSPDAERPVRARSAVTRRVVTDERREQLRAAGRRHYHTHKQEMRAKSKAFREAHPDYWREWRAKHPGYEAERKRKKKEMMKNDT